MKSIRKRSKIILKRKKSLRSKSLRIKSIRKSLRKRYNDPYNNPYFIHFGCWNNGFCAGDTGVYKTMKKLSEIAEKAEFIIIAGDNIYPLKKDDEEGKRKMLIKKNFNSGMKCIKDNIKNKNIYMLLGNHDLEKLLDEETEKNLSCFSNTLTKAVSENQNITLVIEPTIRILGKTIIFMINSSIYDEYDKYDSINVADCMANFNSSFSNMTLDLIIDKYTLSVNNLKYTDNYSNIVIECHDPLLYFKFKKEVKTFLYGNNKYHDLIYSIYSSFPNKNYYYLCADLHQYQAGIITMTTNDNKTIKINQFISGTGGAVLDKQIPDEHKNIPYEDTKDKKYKFTYTMSISDKRNGFLKCTNSDDQISVEFINVD